MRPMSYVRRLHFEQLRYSLDIFRYMMHTAEPSTLTTYRDGGVGWTTAEVIGHLLDCERLFLERAQLTMTQDSPMLPFPDQDEDVVKGRYNERDPLTTFQEWEQVRADYLAYLGTVPEEGWTREGRHHTYAPFSLLDQLLLCSWHDMVHAEQVTRILAEKRVS